MTKRHNSGHRRTVGCAGDPRVGGEYEQTMEWPSIVASWQFVAPGHVAHTALTCTGRVRHVECFHLGTLVELARLQPNGDFGVEMVDLLAAVGLEHDAEVVLFTDASNDQLAVPVRDLMHGGRLVLGAIGDRFRPLISVAPRLELTGWTETDEPFRPVSMSACTFQEFVESQ